MKAIWNSRFTQLETNNHTITKVDSFDSVPVVECGMILIDHAPAERRQVEIARFKDFADILVCHDSELREYYSYDFDQFKYQFTYNVYPKTTTFVSNTIDIGRLLSADLMPLCDCHGLSKCPSYGNTGAIS